MSEQAGQEGPTPDFIPGWFKRRDGAPAEYIEAVRLVGENEGFPLHFLRSGESVSPARPTQRGVTITFEEQPQFGLAVPPGYWIVRESTGRLRLGAHDEFRATWTRAEDRDWIPPVKRAERAEQTTGRETALPADLRELVTGDRPAWAGEPPAEGTRRKLILDTIREHDGDSDEGQLELADAIEAALIDGCDVPTPSRRQLRTALLPPIEEHDYRLLDGQGGKLTPANAVDLANEIERAMRSGGAAELPAEETRRRVIFAVLSRMYQDKTVWPLTPQKVVDAIEAALRDADEITDVDRLNAIAEERWKWIGELEEQLAVKQATLEGLAATVSAQADALEKRVDALAKLTSHSKGDVPAGTRELRVVLADHPDADEPRMLFVEIEDQDGRSLGNFERRHARLEGLTEIVIPYGRDDEWVQQVVMAAVQAGHDNDVPFPGDTVDQVLQRFGVKPSRPRTWPKIFVSAPEPVAEDAPEEARTDTRPPDEWDCRTAACERLHERLVGGGVPNAAELARVIDILG